jgi:hypothetical protein
MTTQLRRLAGMMLHVLIAAVIGLAPVAASAQSDTRAGNALGMAGKAVNDLTAAAGAELQYQHYGQAQVIQDVDLDQTTPIRNVARYTEDLTWAYWIVTGAAKTGTTKTAIVDGRAITLSEITATSFNNSLESRFSAASLTPFVVGKKYLLSYYVWSADPQWFWMRAVATTGSLGHGALAAPKGVLTRVWTVFTATSTSLVDAGLDPTVTMGSGTAQNPTVFQLGSTQSPAASIYVGGFQIEAVPDSYKPGVALIGDSTDAGSSGKIDTPRDFRLQDNREISTVLGALLRVPFFNRAVGGERCDQMDTRWATDMTPLKAWAAHSAIRCGINDIGQGRTFSQIQASITSMVNKSNTDGMTPMVFTITPTATIGANPTMEALRQQVNAWVKATYNACDVAAAVEDPANPGYLRPEWWGDGTHFVGIGKTSAARYIVKNCDFSWRVTPGTYQQIFR